MMRKVMDRRDLKPGSKLVLYYLAEKHDAETGKCVLSFKDLKEAVGMCNTTTRHTLRKLEEAGLITRRKRFEGKRMGHNQFDLHL